MVEELLENFSAVVSDVCACLMGFKVRLDHFWRKNSIRLPIRLLVTGSPSRSPCTNRKNRPIYVSRKVVNIVINSECEANADLLCGSS